MRIFALMLIREIGLQFYFFVVSLSSFGMRVILPSQNELCSVPSHSISWNSLRRVGISSSVNV
jgi:hypothetical protein